MEIPQGFEAKGECPLGSKLVCKLQKSLYGLKQAYRQWNAKFTEILMQFGFLQSRSDYSLFTRTTADGSFVALLVYVDDILVASSSMQSENEVKQFLKSKFKLKDLGARKYFLGIEVARSEKGILLCQRKYALDLIEEHGLLGAKPTSTPIDYSHKLTIASDDDLLTDSSNYRQLIGKLLYLTFTGPDIMYGVQVLSQFMDRLGNVHLQVAYRILKYLKGSPGQGILLSSSSKLQLRAYCDSDWAGCPSTRKSVTSYAIFIGDSLISWKSKKQSVTAKSSTEAEYRAMSTTCCEIIWLLFLLKDFGVSHSDAVDRFCDNQSALSMCKNPVFHERTKHIEVDCHFIREKVLAGIVKPSYIRTDSQLADLFTKAIPIFAKQDEHFEHPCSS
ncbi:PREDICTED: uncharacterized mitochondrial protein AtMg00810-like [Theobroma cacao]|uniref:Uncharacterized mitochondrial protein AtMg00810-like n=1 Tax=Theobroma cacao TaxID=3641 RepID=A0AB32W6T5_THECC|nr:PREDICTED: uncharacterized mitochondrial protein AtMg00810-like [Theobroma cacao]